MTGQINGNTITVRQGDSLGIYINASEDCKPVDLTGASLLMQVREQDSGNLMFSLQGVSVDIAKGKMALLLTPMHTSIPVGNYVTDIQLTLADGSVNTIYPANVNQVAIFRITPQVTEG